VGVTGEWVSLKICVVADGRKTTPAMAAGVANHVWTCHEIAALLD
jgi:hypothetical protein